MSKVRVKYPDGSEKEVPFGRGLNGKSAYEYAKEGGYTGTEEEFAAKLAAEYLTSESDPTVPSWAKQTNKPSYTKNEVGLDHVDNVKQYSASNPPPYPVTNVNGKTGAVTITVPTKMSELDNDDDYVQVDDLSPYAKTSAIPTKTSQLTNDSGFLTSVPSEYITETELTNKGYAVKSSAETWTFTLSDGSTVTKKVVLG